MNLHFIGMRGAGKTNVSRRVGLATKRAVLSTDVIIEYEAGGVSIANMIATSGGDWGAFRDLEFEVLRKICALDGIIVDCGGGVVVDVDSDGNEIFSERKVELLRAGGPVIWLKGDIARLAEKTRNSAARPSLSEVRSLEELMHSRVPFYERAANYTIDIEGRERKELAEEIVEMFRGDLTP